MHIPKNNKLSALRNVPICENPCENVQFKSDSTFDLTQTQLVGTQIEKSNQILNDEKYEEGVDKKDPVQSIYLIGSIAEMRFK